MPFTQTVKLDKTIPGLATGDQWFTGTTQEAREIHMENLAVDFTITYINFLCLSVVGITGNDPAIIRIYQEGQESMAALLEVSGTGRFTSTISLDITAAQGSNRTLIIDQYL